MLRRAAPVATVSVLLLSLIALPGVPAIAAAPSLAAHWKLDELTAGLDAEDSVGNNDGTPTSDPVPSTDVPTVNFTDPRSASFDGEQYFTVNRPVQNSFTVCAWIKTESEGGGSNHWESAPILDSEYGGVAFDFGFGIGNGGRLMFGNGGIVDGYLVDRQVDGETQVNNGEWHNVCATRNNENGEIKLYVDAELDGSGTTGIGSLDVNPQARIGYGFDGAALYVGLIDDVRVYNGVLSDEQLQAITDGEDNVIESPIEYASGNGTEGNPYRISDCEQLQGMEWSLSSHYVLANDVDCSETPAWNGGKGFDPVGEIDAPFTGSFDGNGFSIDHLFINRVDDDYGRGVGDEDYVGLFGVALGSDISDVQLTFARIRGYQHVGGVVGLATNTMVDESTVNQSVAIDDDCNVDDGYCIWARYGAEGGGVVGTAESSTISHSTVGGPVKGSGNTIGGIVGYANDSTISHSNFNGAVDGGYCIGGLAGEIDGTAVEYATAAGSIVGQYDGGKTGDSVGGLIGCMYESSLTQSSFNGNVTASEYIGGAVGYAEGASIGSVETAGAVTGGHSVGGIVGEGYDITVANSTSNNHVNGIDYIYNTTSQNFGGIIGYGSQSAITDSAATGDVRVEVSEDHYVYSVGGAAGYLDEGYVWNTAASGDVFAPAAIDVGGLIGHAEDLATEGPGIWHGSATGDVVSWYEAGGLIGYGSNLGVYQSYATGDVSGSDYGVGGLVGYSYQMYLEEVSAYGNVAGNNGAGGLVGWFEDNEILNSFARGNVTASGEGVENIGGLIGYQDSGNYYNTYATGHISAPVEIESIGGLTGDGWGDDYSSFWDVETTGQMTSAGGIGKTTAEMKNVATYTDQDTEGLTDTWDFTDNPFDDTNNQDIWAISADINDGYPCLTWQLEIEGTCIDGPDVDEDGITTEEEDAAPNGGDANNDGIPDSKQPNVASFVSSVTAKYVTIALPDSCQLSSVSSAAASTASTKDAGYIYNDGLINFSATCSGPPGATINVAIYHYGVSSNGQVVRKYNPNTHAYFTLTDAVLAELTIDSQTVTKITYTIADGGDRDIDGELNGVIVDPVGLANLVVGAPNTGLGLRQL